MSVWGIKLSWLSPRDECKAGPFSGTTRLYSIVTINGQRL